MSIRWNQPGISSSCLYGMLGGHRRSITAAQGVDTTSAAPGQPLLKTVPAIGGGGSETSLSAKQLAT